MCMRGVHYYPIWFKVIKTVAYCFKPPPRNENSTQPCMLCRGFSCSPHAGRHPLGLGPVGLPCASAYKNSELCMPWLLASECILSGQRGTVSGIVCARSRARGRRQFHTGFPWQSRPDARAAVALLHYCSTTAPLPLSPALAAALVRQ